MMEELPPLSMWLSTFGLVFAIVDPFGYVPIFISMTSRDTEERRRWMLKRACLTAGLVLGLFTIFGNHILGFFGISIPALQITGGILLLVIGLEMLKVFPFGEKLSSAEKSEGEEKEDISIIPLAIPMLSGPAAIATVIVLGSETDSYFDYVAILSSIAATLFITFLTLRSAGRILKLLGVTGLNVVTRVMGLLLSAMAVQFVINGYLTIR